MSVNSMNVARLQIAPSFNGRNCNLKRRLDNRNGIHVLTQVRSGSSLGSNPQERINALPDL
jgi:hypothetical protein